MSVVGSTVDAMFSGLEALHKGVTSLQQEIDRLKAENAELRSQMLEFQDQVARADYYIAQMVAAEPLGRILPHDTVVTSVIPDKKKKGY